MLIKPQLLMPGDTVAAVSPSWGGAHTFPQRYLAGKRQLEEAFGVRVIEARHTLRLPRRASPPPRYFKRS